MVAHINDEEADLLKSLGGSGTINPTTGLPEFGFGSIFKPVTRAVGQLNPFNPGSAVGGALQQVPGVKEAQNLGTQVFQPLEKAVVQPASRGLASFDKAVGNTIPGGWGTVGMIAGSAMGLPTWAMTGLGALNGSGVMRPGRGFNLQGAMMGGAMAYGMSSLGEYARAAVPSGTESAFEALPTSDVMSQVASNIDPSVLESMSTEQVAQLAKESIGSSVNQAGVNAATGQLGSGLAGNASGMLPPPSIGSNIMAGNFGDALSQIGANVGEFANTATNPETYKQLGTDALNNVAKTGEGIKNLVGAGEGTASAASKLATASSGISPTAAATGTIYGGMGLAALEEQRTLLDQQKAANAITEAEYNQAVAEIDKSIAQARGVVAASPFSTTPNRDVSIGETYYDRTGGGENLYTRNTAPESRLYAVGGSVDDESGMDEARGLAQGNLQNGFMGGGITSGNLALRELSQPAFNEGAVGGMQSFAQGGIARFLSGGGDGMSDDIPARINGKQEARLADGEFVIPADVVSHLGNGSSKAGAKQLYSMMDKVRSARTGTKKQGKQINPRKFLAA